MQTRTPIRYLALSAIALVGLVTSEGYVEKAMIPVKGDVPTIGFGTTGGVKLGDVTTPVRALSRSLSDIQKFEKSIKKCVVSPLYQYEYDVLVDMSYNLGSKRICNSTMVKLINSNDYLGACSEILKWTYFQGKNCALPENKKLCGGLVLRREREYKTCMGEKE